MQARESASFRYAGKISEAFRNSPCGPAAGGCSAYGGGVPAAGINTGAGEYNMKAEKG